MNEKNLYSSNQRVEIILRNGTTLTGFIVGFFMDPDNNNEVVLWHFVREEEIETFRFHIGNYPYGEYISPSAVKSIVFA